jgi:2,4-dienoyl-CoA reductase (NADPH2)
VRAAIGARPLIYRLSADERVKGGLGIAETAALVPALEAAGVDAFHISSGTQVGALEQIIDPMNFAEGWRLDYADALRAVTKKPLITVGMRWPSSAERAIADARTDLIALGRPLLADADWANKAAAGREDLLRPCTSCNWCMDRVFRHLPVGCAENPLTGQEDAPKLPRGAAQVGGEWLFWARARAVWLRPYTRQRPGSRWMCLSVQRTLAAG